MQINPEKLITLRKAAGLTVQELAEKAPVGRATITRIEHGRTTSSNGTTVSRLARALHCRPEDLSTPPDEVDHLSILAHRRSIKIEMSAASHNALLLIAARYGEQEATILELAPLLFDMVATESLVERRRNLTELREHRDAIGDMADRFPHFGDRFTNDWDATPFDDREERSITQCDLRGEFVHADETMEDSFYPEDYEESSDNPFVAHLRRRWGRISNEGYQAPTLEAIPRWTGPYYEIGFAEADKIAGGDEGLAAAIVSGSIPISSIPTDLRKEGRMIERQAWMRERVAENAKRTDAIFKELGIDTSLFEE